MVPDRIISNGFTGSSKTVNKASYPPQGYWIETLPNGERAYCHKIRRAGKIYTIRKTLRELVEILDYVKV